MAPSEPERYDDSHIMSGSYMNEDYHMMAPSIEPFNVEHYPAFLPGDEMDTFTTENTPSLTHQRSPVRSIDDLEESLESFPETHTWEEHFPQSRHDAPHPNQVDMNQVYMDPKQIIPSSLSTQVDATSQLPPVEAATHSRACPAYPNYPTHHPSTPTRRLCCAECQKSFRRPTEYNKDRKRHEKPLRCDSCGHRDHSNKDFRRHLASCQPAAHGTPRVACHHAGCESTFARRDGLYKHQRDLHGAPKRATRRRPRAE